MKQLSLLGFLNAGKRDQTVPPKHHVPIEVSEEDISEIFYYDRRPVAPPVLTSSSDDSHASVILNGELFIDEENDTDADIDDETDDESLTAEVSDEDHDNARDSSPEDFGEMFRYFIPPCEVMVGRRSAIPSSTRGKRAYRDEFHACFSSSSDDSSSGRFHEKVVDLSCEPPAKKTRKQPECSTVGPSDTIQDPEPPALLVAESSPNRATMSAKTPMHASPAELAESIITMGRNAYVRALAGNPGYTPRKSRKRSAYDNDGVIYLILNRLNLKTYVGQTDNVDERFREHLSGNGGAKVLKCAIAKHGPENFVRMILLAGTQDQTELDSAEIAAIAHLDCLTSGGRGYNLQLGGMGGRHSPETKVAIGAAHKLRHASRTPEDKAAISAALELRRASRTPEEKAAMSAANKEWYASRTPTEKAVISAAHKLRRASRTPEEKAAISAANRKMYASKTPAEKAAFSAAMSAAQKLRHASRTVILFSIQI